jgi:hypothetical protein
MNKQEPAWEEVKRLWERGYSADLIISAIEKKYKITLSRSTIYYRSKTQGWENRIRDYEKQERQRQVKQIMKKYKCSPATAYKYKVVKEYMIKEGLKQDIKLGKHKKSIDYYYRKITEGQIKDLEDYFKGRLKS